MSDVTVRDNYRLCGNSNYYYGTARTNWNDIYYTFIP